MAVLIVATTRMGNRVCVGALDLDSNASLRLLQANGDGFMPGEFAVGEIWEVDYSPALRVVRPHVEDVLVNHKRLVGRCDALRDEIINRTTPWSGSYTTLFGGTLRWTGNGSGFVDVRALSDVSTGFWVPEVALEYHEPYYRLQGDYRRLRYVGLADPVPVIPAGNLVRVSLARWWAPPEGGTDERCYMQLSGWY